MRSASSGYLAIAAGGVLGASMRWAIAELVATGRFPWATFLVNVVGAGALGWISATELSVSLGPALGTGFCGGLTTFSTFSVEIVELIDDGRSGVAAIYGVGSVAAALTAFVLAHALVDHLAESAR